MGEMWTVERQKQDKSLSGKEDLEAAENKYETEI